MNSISRRDAMKVITAAVGLAVIGPVVETEPVYGVPRIQPVLDRLKAYRAHNDQVMRYLALRLGVPSSVFLGEPQ